LVAPASLLANWAAEIERFAPALTAIIAHPSAMTREELNALDRDRLAGVDLVITSYGSLLRVPALLGNVVAYRHPGRSAGDQDTGQQADASGEADRRARAHRAQRHAD
jgi:Superfamily II DNA/RNA helicases, SNF2 family